MKKNTFYEKNIFLSFFGTSAKLFKAFGEVFPAAWTQ